MNLKHDLKLNLKHDLKQRYQGNGNEKRDVVIIQRDKRHSWKRKKML